MKIDDLIVLAEIGIATPEDEAALRRWRSASEENEGHYAETVRVIRLARAAIPPPSSPAITAADLIQRSSLPAPRHAKSAPVSARWVYVGILAAAAMLAAILLQRPPSVEDDPAPMQVFQTGVGEEETVWLEDRTIVHLGPSTRLEATRHPDRPHLRLEGTAFFAVPEQDGRRLIVRTAGGEITVLGTRFAVQAASDNLELLVIDGRVSLSASEEQVEVAESERSVVTGGMIDKVMVLDDPLAYLGWMGRTMIFQATSLARVATEIEHRYGVDIEIENPALRDRTITTIFDDRPIEEVMTIVCAVVGAQCEIGPDRILMH